MASYKRQTYLFMTLDPVHIGTGGYRLGRVDNSIVREPGTKIPKIPGTSLHGAARSYAAQLYETPEAAGQDQKGVTNPEANPICYTFGYVRKSENNNDQGKAFSGVVNIFDAHILLFPVHSMVGPVWVSTVERLKDADFEIENLPDNWNKNENINEVLLWNKSNNQSQERLNLGWLMVNILDTVTVKTPKESKWEDEGRYKAINRIIIVKDALFSQVVNSNLEVRTSVAINPETGAANDGALFTYEAIPRATFLTAEVVLDDYRQAFPSITKTLHTGDYWSNSLDVVKSGFKLIEWLGVGGMGTRGFGRMAIVGSPLEESSNKEKINE